MGSGEFLNINFYTALFTLINTIALFLVLKHFLFAPVMKMIDDRQKEIDTIYADAEQAKSNAQEMETAYRQKLDAAMDAGERLVKEATERGRSREEEIIRNANREADAIREKANADVQLEKKRAINDAKNEISEIAVAIAQKVVGRELNAADQADLVEQFISELGDPA